MMRYGLGRAIICGTLLSAQPAIAGGAVSPNAGPVEGQGTLKDNDGRPGSWSVRAVLKDGNFTGEATISLGGASFSGPLLRGRSYVENGKCYFAFERDRARAALGGPCTTDAIAGKLDGFLPGHGVVVGEMKGVLRFGKPGSAAAAARDGVLPVGKLTCAWWETRVSYKAGEMNGRELRFSNMATLTLLPAGTYRTANTSGTFVREGSRIRLTSGAFGGAVGQLRADRSGQPAVYFERDENRRANGVHIVDPATTACTKARG
jgi:hypothetical protein